MLIDPLSFPSSWAIHIRGAIFLNNPFIIHLYFIRELFPHRLFTIPALWIRKEKQGNLHRRFSHFKNMPSCRFCRNFTLSKRQEGIGEEKALGYSKGDHPFAFMRGRIGPPTYRSCLFSVLTWPQQINLPFDSMDRAQMRKRGAQGPDISHCPCIQKVEYWPFSAMILACFSSAFQKIRSKGECIRNKRIKIIFTNKYDVP